jgi:hypothetical protein
MTSTHDGMALAICVTLLLALYLAPFALLIRYIQGGNE